MELLLAPFFSRAPYKIRLKHVAFCTKMTGHHHVQGNLQVYNARIPVFRHPNRFPRLRRFFVRGDGAAGLRQRADRRVLGGKGAGALRLSLSKSPSSPN